MKKIVLTGGPSVGKTSVIEILSARGYSTIPEAARIIIAEERAKGTDISSMRNVEAFQEQIAQKQIDLEKKAAGEVVFFDRGIIDGYAYCEAAGVNIPQAILSMSRGRYDEVFLLESLGTYVQDGIRSRGREDGEKVHKLIADAYRKFGYNLIHVPVLPAEARADFILSHLFK